MNVFDELRQRKVLQTAALYFAIAWGATEILSFLVDQIPVFPAWTNTAIAILFVLGFPVTVFLAWMFDVSGEGVRRADPSSGLGKGVIILSLTGLLIATGGLSYLLIPRIDAGNGLGQTGDIGTVAVLPLENLTGDPSLGYLGVGLAEDIRQRLSSFTDLKVIGRVSVAGFGGAGTDLATVRNVLDAGLVLEGNVQKVAGQMQVSLALLDTASGKQIWSSVLRTDQAGWEPLRQRIVSSLAEQLALTVRVKEAGKPVPDEALTAYMHGLAELGNAEVADGYFEEATRVAPDFADAWARRALLRVEMIWRGEPPNQAWQEAEPMFSRAREIDPDNLLADIAEAHLLWLAKLDPFASYEVLQRAAVEAPNHPMVLAGLSTSLGFMLNRQSEAVSFGRRYLAQDPLNPDAHNRLGLALNFNRQLDEALEENQRAIDLDPGFNRAWDYRVNWLFHFNRQAEAMATLTRRAALERPVSDETKRCMVHMAGDLLPEDRAISLLRDAIQRGIGMTQAHWWCTSPRELLSFRLELAGRLEEAARAREDHESWLVEAGGQGTDSESIFNADPAVAAACDTELCRLKATLGEGVFQTWLDESPHFQYFQFELVVSFAKALIEAGELEQGKQLAIKAAAAARDFAGPAGYPTTTMNVVALYALSGDVNRGLEYAEQVGPEGFFMFGVFNTDFMGLQDDRLVPVGSNPRWLAFLERCRTRWMQEVDKFDRLIAAGEIIMP